MNSDTNCNVDLSKVSNFIKYYNLVIDNSQSSDNIIYIRSSIQSEEQALVFVDEFSEITGTEWKVHLGVRKLVPNKGFKLCNVWVCHRANIHLDPMKSAKNADASMEILLKREDRLPKKRKKKRIKFPLNESFLPCLIRFHTSRPCQCKQYCKVVNIHDEVKDLFFKYFDDGFNTVTAKQVYEKHKQTNENHNISQFVLSKRRILHLHSLWLEEKKFGRNAKKNKKSEGPSIVFDLEVFIRCIPRKDHLSENEELNPNSPSCISSETESHRSSDNNTPDSISVTENDNLQTNVSVNNTPSSNNLISSPVSVSQSQNISVNSPSHLTGSVITVNTSDVITYLPSSSSNGQINCNIAPQVFSTNSNTTSMPSIISCFESGKDKSLASVKENTVLDFREMGFKTVSSVSNVQISSQSLPSLPRMCINTVQSPSYLSSFTTKELTGSTITEGEQIHIRNTTLQSGAQVSMNPVHQSNQRVAPIYFSVSQSTVPPSKQPLNIKEKLQKPLEVFDFQESENSVSLPVIIDVCSLNKNNGSIKEEVISDTDDSEGVSSNSGDFHTSSASEYLIPDDDYDFLMSILPKFKEIPDDLKKQLKRQIRNLVTTSSIANKRRKQLK